MARSRTAKRVVFVAVAMISLSAAHLFAGGPENGRRAGRHAAKLNLQQAVSIAVDRNLRLTDSRLATQEKEHQRREAFSDFFPSTNLQYTSTWYRYEQATNIAALAGTSPARWVVRGFNPVRPTSDQPGLSVQDRSLSQFYAYSDNDSADLYRR